MGEFKVSIKQESIITGNFEEIKAELATMMTAYAELEVNEKNLPERKKDIATLRKIRGAIEDKRKATKRVYEKPYKEFETECKALTGIIDKEIDRIDGELKQYEAKRVAVKQEACRKIYDANIGEYAEYLPYERIAKPEWVNKTYTENAILCDIQEAITQVKSDFGILESMCGEWHDECFNTYKKYGNNLVAALQRAKDLASAKQAAEAAVNGSEQKAPATAQEAPAEYRKVFTITVDNEDDARIIRDTCKACGFKFMEE